MVRVGRKVFRGTVPNFQQSIQRGIFDDAAKVVLDMVCRVTGFSPEMICQHLDDICGACSDRERLEVLDSGFKAVAAELE